MKKNWIVIPSPQYILNSIELSDHEHNMHIVRTMNHVK